MKKLLFLVCIGAVFASAAYGIDSFETDTLPVEGGEVLITFIGHASLMLEYGDQIVHVDPVSSEANYSNLPDGDIILITHGHRDHLDNKAIEKIRSDSTVIIHTEATAGSVKDGRIMENGDIIEVAGITIEAVPAYNTTSGRSGFHPKGRDNGYVVTLGGKKFYFAGDTENTPEMMALEGIYVAFLPVNQPYTMVPEQAAVAAKAFQPKVLYPYHFGRTKVEEIKTLLADEPDIEVRIRKLD